MSIYDGFMFNNEFELLKLRCEELKPLNPVHILVESDCTFSGLPKPLHFHERRHEFSQYNIVAKVYRSNATDPWIRERAQRNVITANQPIGDDDIVLITDADEIPRCSSISEAMDRIMCSEIQMSNYRYYLNRQENGGWWHHPRIVKGSFLKAHSPSELRNTRYGDVVEDAGWHFSWMGGIERIHEKVKSFAHTEMHTARLQTTEPWLKDFKALPYHEIDESYPKYVVGHKHEFDHMIHPITKITDRNIVFDHRDIGPYFEKSTTQ